MKRRNAELLLAAIIITRSSAFMFSKIALRTLEPFNLMGIRFTLAFLVMAVIFHKRLANINLKTLGRGALLGFAFFGLMSCELHALKTTDSSTTSFLENTAIIWVPLTEAVLHRCFPSRKTLVCGGFALAGVGLLTLQKGSFQLTPGECLCILGAAFYTCAIICTDRTSRKDDALTLGILQVGFIGLFGLIASFIFETPRLPSAGAEWGSVLFLSLVCSCFGFTLQPVAQRYTTSQRTGMFCAINPLSATTLGALLLNEKLTWIGVFGALLILCGILMQNLTPELAHKLLHLGEKKHEAKAPAAVKKAA